MGSVGMSTRPGSGLPHYLDCHPRARMPSRVSSTGTRGLGPAAAPSPGLRMAAFDSTSTSRFRCSSTRSRLKRVSRSVCGTSVTVKVRSNGPSSRVRLTPSRAIERHRLFADGYDVGPPAKPVDIAPGLEARQVDRLSGATAVSRRREVSIQRRGCLEQDERPFEGLRRDERPDEFERLVAQHADLDIDVRGADAPEPPAAGARIRVGDAHDEPANAAGRDMRRTRRRAALVIAGLERAVERRASRKCPRLTEGRHFRMFRASPVMGAAPDNRAFAHDDGADRRVRPRPTRNARGEAKSLRHERRVFRSRWAIHRVLERGGGRRQAYDKLAPGRRARRLPPTSPIQTVTVGPGISPDRALAGSRALPPVGTCTPPRSCG